MILVNEVEEVELFHRLKSLRVLEDHLSDRFRTNQIFHSNSVEN